MYPHREPVDPCCVCGGPVYSKGENGYYDLHDDCDRHGAQKRLAGTEHNEEADSGGGSDDGT